MTNTIAPDSVQVRHSRSSGVSLIEITIVMLVTMAVGSLAIPKVISIVRELRTAGDARNLNGAILLAKMRAAANFSRARVYVDLAANTYRVEWQQSGTTTWTAEGSDQYLAKGVSFGFGSLTSPPSNTQSTLAQAPICAGTSNTACVIFNSRGIPIDSTASPTGEDALYVTDGRSVTGVTVSATGLTHVWRSGSATARWIQR